MIIGFLLLGSIGKITSWVINKTCGSYAKKVNLIIDTTFTLIIALIFLVVVGMFFYKNVIDFSEKSVVDSIPKMETTNI